MNIFTIQTPQFQCDDCGYILQVHGPINRREWAKPDLIIAVEHPIQPECPWSGEIKYVPACMFDICLRRYEI